MLLSTDSQQGRRRRALFERAYEQLGGAASGPALTILTQRLELAVAVAPRPPPTAYSEPPSAAAAWRGVIAARRVGCRAVGAGGRGRARGAAGGAAGGGARGTSKCNEADGGARGTGKCNDADGGARGTGKRNEADGGAR